MINVYSLGSNGNYQLGLGHPNDMIVPQLSLQLEQSSEAPRVEKIVCGGNHTVILLDDGNAFVCGDNRANQLLDRNTTDSSALIKKFVRWPVCAQSRLLDVACGWEFTVIVDSNFKIWSRGEGLKGELGLGQGVTRSECFQRVPKIDTTRGLRNPPRVFSSFQNCVVVLQLEGEVKSRVYGWGSNNYCQLFKPRCKAVAEPTFIYESKDTVIDYVAMGKNFIVFVDTEGTIVDITGKIPEGFKLEDWNCISERRILQVCAMWSSIHIRTSDDKIFSYGFRMFGQLFDNEAFREISKQPNCQILSMNTGSEHGIIVTKTDNCSNQPEGVYGILCWGWGEHGNCGRLSRPNDQQQITVDDQTMSIVNDYSNVVSPLNELMRVTKTTSSAPMVFGGCANTWIVTYT